MIIVDFVWFTKSHDSFLSLPSPPSSHLHPRATRRESFPVSRYDRPLNPTTGVYLRSEVSQHLPTETSPLLDHPLVPQIENGDYSVSAENTSNVNMSWEQLSVLTKYAIPVFGYAPSFIFGYSIIHGLTSALDTVLPSAWSSTQPQLVGLWAQRMSQYIYIFVDCVMSTDSVITTVVVFMSLAVSSLVKNIFSHWLPSYSLCSWYGSTPN